MASKIIKAYWGSGSAPARRMLLALEEKGLKYESHMISFSKGEHKSPEALAINPRGKVPYMLDGEVPIYESLAIIQYLETVYPTQGASLLPADDKGRAEAFARLQESEYVATTLAAGFRNAPKDGKTEEWAAKHAEIQKTFYDELKRWDTYLNGKKFLVGDKISIADVAFYPYLDQAVRLGLTFGKFPNLAAYHKHMSCRPSAEKSYPPHWKEGPAPFTPFD